MQSTTTEMVLAQSPDAEAAAPSEDELIDEELLVEEISIDGMCGVY
jgi:mycofactocin precursor